MDLNKLLEWAKSNQLNLKIWFSEASGLFDIEVTGAPSEDFCLKNCTSEKIFIDFWNKHIDASKII
jgi:hypothetical protein